MFPVSDMVAKCQCCEYLSETCSQSPTWLPNVNAVNTSVRHVPSLRHGCQMFSILQDRLQTGPGPRIHPVQDHQERK
jgi:hypothetical protein